MSFANTEILPKAGGYFLGPVGRVPYNKRSSEDSLQAFYKAADVVEQHLLVNTFLAGERLTLADIFAAGVYQRPFLYILDKKWRATYPNTGRWFETVVNQPFYSAVCPKVVLCDEILKNAPPAKPAGEQQPKKEKAPKEAAKPKAEGAAAAKPSKKKDEDEEEEEDKPAPKAKHPLEELGRPTLVLDDWKRKYSNEETREAALPWFWENLKPDEYSLWKIDYKYNDELTMTFMTSNLIGMCTYPSIFTPWISSFPFLLFSTLFPPNFGSYADITLFPLQRWVLRPPRSLAQVPLRRVLCVWRDERQHHQGRVPRARPGRRESLRRRARLRVLRVHQARPYRLQRPRLRRRHVGLG